MRNVCIRPLGLVLLSSLSIAAWAHDERHVFSSMTLDRLEMRNGQNGNASYWEGQGWNGSDLNKAWFKSQGEVRQGRVSGADVQLLYSRAVAPFWDMQAGVRHDFAMALQPGRDYAVLAVKGLAPYKFDVDASLYLGQRGLAGRLKSGYTVLLTQRLALLPELEANLYGQGDAARKLGSGLSNLDVGLRLRYEVTREFAPYLGVVWVNRYGDTAGYARAQGEPVSDVLYMAGVRLWW